MHEPVGGRPVARFWVIDTLDCVVRAAREFWEDFRDPDDPQATLPELGAILRLASDLETHDEASTRLLGELLFALLSGGTLPSRLMSAVLARLQEDWRISQDRITVLRAVLNRRRRLGAPEGDAQDACETHPAWELGRLAAAADGRRAGDSCGGAAFRITLASQAGAAKHCLSLVGERVLTLARRGVAGQDWRAFTAAARRLRHAHERPLRDPYIQALFIMGYWYGGRNRHGSPLGRRL